MPKKKMTREIIFILDKSGSMETKKEDAIGGFNQFLGEQKENVKDALFTLVLFDSPGTYNLLYNGDSISNVKELDSNTYIPSGMTALLDAIGKTLTQVSERVKGEKNRKVVCAIFTDGLENTSLEYNKSAILKMIEDKQKEGWDFLYLGCQKEAIGEAMSLGIPASSTVFYANTGVGTRSAYTTVSNLVSSKLNKED